MNLPAAPASWTEWLNKYFYPLLLAGITVNIAAINTTILEPDGALYATIAKSIAQTNDFINLMVNGADWLDKPHFPFWMAAASFKLFGINTMAYKLPALLFWGMGAWYTYKLGKLFYGTATAQLAALIYVSAAHLVISNNDVRAEPYLTGLIAGSVYHFYTASKTKWWPGLLTGALMAGCAVMTKGIFVLLTIFGGLICNELLQQNPRKINYWFWLLALTATLVFTLPELYCLYVQFDLHPGKIIFGNTGVSSIRFFFWDSQFGRFFNTGPIKGSGDPFFYLHTLLWAFLPWSLQLYGAFGWKIRHLGERQNTNPEYITLATIFFTFLLFSLSRFQLPHYLNIIFPFFAIITAQYILIISTPRAEKIYRAMQYGIGFIMMALAVLLTYLFRFPHSYWVYGYLLLIAVAGLLLFKGNGFPSVIGKTFMTAITVYGFLQFFFYPALLHYQAGSEAAFYLRKNKPMYTVLQYGVDSYAFDFYHRSNPNMENDSIIAASVKKRDMMILASAEQIDTLKQRGYLCDTVKSFSNFHISRLTLPFLNYVTRSSELEKWALVKLAVAPQHNNDNPSIPIQTQPFQNALPKNTVRGNTCFFPFYSSRTAKTEAP